MSETQEIVSVNLAERSYEIHIGCNTIRNFGQQLQNWLKLTRQDAPKCLLITDQNVLQPHANDVRQSLKAANFETRVICIKPGESSKCLSEASSLYDELVDFKVDRHSLIIAVGGGVVGDLAGFVAATFMRGLRFVQIPTTLLAMVDSSVGGKTGINHPQGKNLIGAFHQPAGVFIDPNVLGTLPNRDYCAGLAEVVKYGVILDAAFFEYLEENTDAILQRDPATLIHIIARSCELKAFVVKEDEYEKTGLRAILNYGHTYAHAFEALSGYGELLHGEAVAIGMICGSRLAKALGKIDNSTVHRQLQLLKKLNLPTEVPTKLAQQPDKILDVMLLDKKTVAGDLKFVLPTHIGKVNVTGQVPSKAVTAALHSH